MKKQLFYNGTILTMEEEGRQVEAVYVEDGKIKEVGSFDKLKEFEKEKDVQRIDLHGYTMLPAFIDSHSHIVELAAILRFGQLNMAMNFQEIVKIMKEKKEQVLLEQEQKNKEGRKEREEGQAKVPWIIGFGYDHNLLKEGRHPDKFVLDEIAKDVPILIIHASGHMGVLNSKGLALAGITKETKDPIGGKIGRVSGGSEPNGYLEESAFMKVASHMEEEGGDIVSFFQKAQNIYFQYGITTAQDGLTKEGGLKLLKQLNENDILKIDVVSYIDIKDSSHLIKENEEYEKRYKKHLKIGGYKLFLDGSPQGRTAWLSKPYVKQEGQDSDYCGYPIYTKEQVEEFVRKAKEEELQLLTHCNGDRAIDQLLEAQKEPSTMRNVIIHAQTMRLDQLEKVKYDKMIPSYFVAHVYYWGDTHIKNLGMERANKISPAGSTEKKDIIFTFHQDTPVILPNMLETIWCAVNRKTRDGVLLDQEECLSVYDALKAVTINGAYQYFEEEEKGTISIGKRADFVILSDNPLDIEKESIKDMKVMATYKDGELVYQKEEE